MKLGRKAFVFFEMPMWMVRIFFMLFVMLAILFIVSFFIVTEINVQGAQEYTTANVFFYSPEGLAYCDPNTGRCYPGTVDLENKFNYFHLDKFEPGVKDGIAANISYGKEETCRLLNGYCTGDNYTHYNEETYEDLNVLIESGLTSGLGGANKLTEYKYMLLKDSEGTETRMVIFQIVTPNS